MLRPYSPVDQMQPRSALIEVVRYRGAGLEFGALYEALNRCQLTTPQGSDTIGGTAGQVARQGYGKVGGAIAERRRAR